MPHPEKLSLPAKLADRLYALMYDDRALAYMQIDADLVLVSAGGDLDHFGLSTLQPSEPVLEQAFFLEGLLPLSETPYLLPSMELTDSRAADLHFYLEDTTVWVLLLDVTAEREARRLLQQKAYEMTLLQEKQARLNRQLQETNAALLATQRELELSRDLAERELARKQIELAEARTLQLSLVPPAYEGPIGPLTVTVEVILEPAKEVGGDLVDHFCIDDQMLVALLGDVSDKGAGAALVMARTHALFRGLLGRPDAVQLFRQPHEAVRLVNETLSESNPGCMFVTLLLAVLDGASRELTYIRAGHVPPFLRRANGVVERLEAAGGLPLGLMAGTTYRSSSVCVAPGEELLIVTDGITEAANPSYGLFGEKRIAELMSNRVSANPALLVELLEEVRAFEAGGPQSDDIAATWLKVTAA
jgi:serine phosphatase RsbU (regulator of sigma subunit)